MLTKQQCRRKHRRLPRRRVGPNPWERFKANLRMMGFKSYAEYVASDVWAAFREFWKQSGCPCYCAVCGNEDFQLHHWTYQRVCNEDLNDVIPLCEQHHKLLHAFISVKDAKITHIYSQFRDLFGWTATEVRERLWWVFRIRNPKIKRPKREPAYKREARKKREMRGERRRKEHYKKRAARFEDFRREQPPATPSPQGQASPLTPLPVVK